MLDAVEYKILKSVSPNLKLAEEESIWNWSTATDTN